MIERPLLLSRPHGKGKIGEPSLGPLGYFFDRLLLTSVPVPGCRGNQRHEGGRRVWLVHSHRKSAGILAGPDQEVRQHRPFSKKVPVK